MLTDSRSSAFRILSYELMKVGTRLDYYPS